MTIQSLVHTALIVLLLAAGAMAQPPGLLPAPKPPSLWSRLFGRAKPRPLPQAMQAGEIVPNESSGVVRASWEEPAPVRHATPKRVASPPRRRAAPWPMSLFRPTRRPSRTVSEFMAEERP